MRKHSLASCAAQLLPLFFAIAGCDRGAAREPDTTAQQQAALLGKPGQFPPAGSCQFYNRGGTSGIHFYACCNSPPCPPAVTYESASDGNYCYKQADGTTSGGGAASGPAIPATCRTISRCNSYCSAQAWNIPLLCFTYTNCFRKCLQNGGPTALRCDQSGDSSDVCSVDTTVSCDGGACSCSCDGDPDYSGGTCPPPPPSGCTPLGCADEPAGTCGTQSDGCGSNMDCGPCYSTQPTPPPSWSCDPSWYGASDGCDCGCGADDPDCDGGGTSEPGESTSECLFCHDAAGATIDCTTTT